MNVVFTERPSRVQLAIQRIEENVGIDAVNYLSDSSHLFPDNRIVTLSNMWPNRARYIIETIRHGGSVSAAFKYVPGMYDTKDWGEVTSRLRRARGILLCYAAKIYWRPNFNLTDREKDQVDEVLSELKRDLLLLMGHLVSFSLESTEVGVPSIASNNRNENPRIDPLTGAKKNLRTAHSFVKKCLNDVPQIPDKIAVAPSQFERACINMELAKMVSGANIVKRLLFGEYSEPVETPPSFDPFGIGGRYSPWLSSIANSISPGRKIATHRKPDADALVATWMVERFVFPGQACQVNFIGRRRNISKLVRYDCAVDVGCVHDERRLIFDHKPPAFDNRDETCAARLVWNSLQNRGVDLSRLQPLVDLVHDGDAVSRRAGSIAYRKSRGQGLHAHIDCLRKTADSDMIVYNATAMWLDGLFLP